MREIIEDLGAAFYIVLAIVILVCFFCVDLFGADYVTEGQAEILEKVYSPSETSTGTGVGVGSNGGTAIVTTTSHKSEKFILIVRKANNDIQSIECTPDYYYSKEEGESISISKKVGYLTGWTYKTIPTK